MIEGTKSQVGDIAGIETLHTMLVRKESLIVGYRRKRAKVIGVEGTVPSFWRESRGMDVYYISKHKGSMYQMVVCYRAS